MSTHTPGPWENTPGQSTIWANDGDLKVATVDDLPWVENSSGRRSSDWMTEAANARLIAACPDLLQFAETVARSACLDQRVGDKCICFSCEAKRLISKAKGEA